MLKQGKGSFKYNMDELTKQPIQSPSRKKAIQTIAKEHKITFEQARAFQAVKIAKSKFSQG